MADDGVFRTPETSCPACGYTLNATGGIEHDEAPKPGDYTVCARCYRILRFNAELMPRDLTPAEQVELAQDAEAQLDLERTRLALMAYWPKRPR